MDNDFRSKVVYAMITSHCNLTCSYCTIRNATENFNQDEFIRKLTEFNGRIILFGGEPTLYRDRLFNIYYNEAIRPKAQSITTNLMILDDELIKLFKDIGVVGTSWNPTRFSSSEYDVWLNHLNQLGDHGIRVGILATMTKELIEIPPQDILAILNSWNPASVHNINFELCIAEYSTPEYFRKCDDWLCEMYQIWNCKFIFRNADTIMNWYHDCSNVYTLRPDGTLVNRCPQGDQIKMPVECYSCEYNEICKPCQLQQHCSYMKNFANLAHRIHNIHRDSTWINNLERRA